MMNVVRPSSFSLATRLTLWYAIVAFVLLSAFALVQYNLLVKDLESEDDELLLQTLGAASRGAIPVDAIAAPGTLLGPHVRVLDGTCKVLVGKFDAHRPPPMCNAAGSSAAALRTWIAPDGRLWRSASRRIPQLSSVGSLPEGTVWVDASLDRWTDVAVLQSYRRKLVALLPVAILLSCLIGYIIARRGLVPLEAISRSLADVDVRSLSQRFETPLGNGSVPAEIRRLVRSLEEMREKLNERFKTLERFSADLAHEFRTPLHILRQQAEIALTQPRTDSAYREVLASSLEEYERLNRMIADTLFLARVEEPETHITVSLLTAVDEIEAVVVFLEALSTERNVNVTIEAAREISIHADRSLLRRALVNVLSNAIDHTPPGRHVSVSVRRDDDAVELVVTDRGEGIPEADLPRVFDRYFHGKRSVHHEGSGLGLSIVRGIMTLHGGTVSIVSNVGEGTVVSMRFPEQSPNLTKL